MSSSRPAARATAVCLAFAAAGFACYASGPPGAGAGDDNVVTLEASGRLRVDLLFVVDNSGSMAQEQEAAARHFGALLLDLIDPPDADGDGRPDAIPVEDIHVGVVSTDMGTMGYVVSTCANPDTGDDGCFLHAPASAVADCAPEYPPFLARDPANAAEYPPDRLAHDFACVTTLGTRGCGFEQPLEAMRRAAAENQEPGRCNEGFLRDDSVLALVVITTVDPVTPTQIIPSCNTTMGVAFPPVRIVELARRCREAGGGTWVGSICRPDWSAAAEGIRRTIAERLAPECLPYELEVEASADPERPDPSCAANCALVEMLPESRACRSDPACPPEACPPATLDDVLAGRAAPCRLPGGTGTCEPPARDLGLVRLPGGSPFRGCLVRQEPGAFDADLGRCVAPADAVGWRYVPPAWGDGPGGPCPRVELPGWLQRERDEGAVLRLYCGPMRCPFERQCGPPGTPAASCCAAGAICGRDAATGEGACFGPGG